MGWGEAGWAGVGLGEVLRWDKVAIQFRDSLHYGKKAIEEAHERHDAEGTGDRADGGNEERLSMDLRKRKVEER